MKNFLIFILSLSAYSAASQVGLGEAHPTAALEVKTEATGLSALRLNPQSNPVGTETGQMAIIGSQLYMFDAPRDKWLSVEQTTLEYGRLGSGSDPAEVEYGGGDLQNGPRMPFDGTIVSVSLSATDDNNREISLFINNVLVPNDDTNVEIDGVFNLDPVTLRYEDTNYNLNFNTGDMLSFQVDGAVNDIDDLVVTMSIKWRKDNL